MYPTIFTCWLSKDSEENFAKSIWQFYFLCQALHDIYTSSLTFNTELIRGDGGALDTNIVLFDGVGTIHRYWKRYDTNVTHNSLRPSDTYMRQ